MSAEISTKHALEAEARQLRRRNEPFQGGNSVRVLLVEDHAELAELTAQMLCSEGLDVRVAGSGREALDSASKFRPQLVLCDLHLPDISGKM